MSLFRQSCDEQSHYWQATQAVKRLFPVRERAMQVPRSTCVRDWRRTPPARAAITLQAWRRTRPCFGLVLQHGSSAAA